MILLFLILLVTSCHTSIPELNKSGNNISELIPKNWILISKAEGDINNDGYNDLAFVIQSTYKRNIYKNKGEPGSKTIDLNPRIFAIYFKDPISGKYNLRIQKDRFILIKDSPIMEEPFEDMKINNKGVLIIYFNIWYNAGSWSAVRHIYKFKLYNNKFKLIGYDRNELIRNTGETTDYSYNFLTNKMKISKGNVSNDEPDSIIWKNINNQKEIFLEDIEEIYQIKILE